MHLLQLLMFSFVIGLVALATYASVVLLKSAQIREDAEDEFLWHYLLDPRKP